MRAVGYIRVSTDKREQADSLKNQEQLILQEIAKRGYSFCEVFIDIESGTSDKRKNYLRMLEAAERKEFDVVIVKELSRLARNEELAHRFKRILENFGIALITLDGLTDTTKTGEDFNYGLYAWMSRVESEKISTRTKLAFKSKMKNGQYLGSTAPYGYTAIDKKLCVKEDNAPNVVKLIFQKYLDGWGQDRIARYLKKNNFPTPSQVANKRNSTNLWHGSSVRDILQNPHYVGDLVQGRETSTSAINKKRKLVPRIEQIILLNFHEPIIDRILFDRVQELISSRKKNGVGTFKESKHLFTNLLFCEDCGRHLWYQQNKGGYLCGTHIKHGNDICKSHKIKEQDLVEAILNDLRTFAQTINREKIAAKLISYRQKKEIKKNNMIPKLISEIERLTIQKRKCLERLINEDITKAAYDDYIENTDMEIYNTEVQLIELRKNSSTSVMDYSKLSEEISEYLKLNSLTPEMISKFVDRIEVNNEGSPMIHYSFGEPIEFR